MLVSCVHCGEDHPEENCRIREYRFPRSTPVGVCVECSRKMNSGSWRFLDLTGVGDSIYLVNPNGILLAVDSKGLVGRWRLYSPGRPLDAEMLYSPSCIWEVISSEEAALILFSLQGRVVA